MKVYREGVPGSGVANFPVLVETLPRLTPLPGHTPAAVNASAVFTAPNGSKVVYDASADGLLHSYQLRGNVGGDYSDEDAIVIATHTPGEAREFLTPFGLNQPGAQVALKVYVILTTGNEAGSGAMLVHRPANVRTEQRRQRREQEAAQMEPLTSSPATEASWHDIAPVLDEALSKLSEMDRHALLLRFFEQRDLRQVGLALGSSEEAAKKRVARAVEKLRVFFLRRGIALPAAALTACLTSNAVQAAPAPLFQAVAAVVAVPGVSTTTLSLVQATMKTMLQVKLRQAALIAGACLIAAGAGTLLAQQIAKPKPAEKAPTASAAPAFDRTTPIGALRDYADALEKSDSNRVARAMHATSPTARGIAQAMAEAVEAEREFKRAVTARFGRQQVKFININFGQAFLYDEEAVASAVQFTDADHATVRLPSRSEPNKPHKVDLVRVDGVWKFPDTETPGLDDSPAKTEALFRKIAVKMAEMSAEIESGQFRSYGEAARALLKRVMNNP